MLFPTVPVTAPPGPATRRTAEDGDVAVIGAGCRLPGADSVDAFWRVLSRGEDALAATPASADAWRFDAAGLDRLRERVPLGGVVPDGDTWDAAFFRTTPTGAVRVDPQHRLALETAWEAVEDAGLSAAELSGARSAVYASCGSSAYEALLREHGIADVHSLLGTYEPALAGHVASALDLHGPSTSIAASCASSLLAVHMAVQALRAGEIDLAVVVAVSRWAGLDQHEVFADAGMLSPTGRCRFGDADSDGFVRSEGAVAMVLRPVAAAREHGDRMYATLLGSATTHNGATVGGLAAPSVEGQVTCLREAYRNARVAATDIDYVEAHGTGTPVGDPVEIEALHAVVGEGRDPVTPCRLGSAKSNVGHTEIVAGAVGLLKTVLAAHHGWLPHTLHVARPHAVFGRTPSLRLLDVGESWDGDRLAGVSATGLTGSNVHVVVGAPPTTTAAAPPAAPSAVVLPVSARSVAALGDLVRGHADLLAGDDAPSRLLDVCHTAAARRIHHEYRAAFVAEDRGELVRALRRFAADPPPATPRFGAGPVAMVFPGHGGEWTGMAREFAATSGTFRARLAECCRAIEAETGSSPYPDLVAGEELGGIDRMQPALWAFQVALAAVWVERGVRPDVVVGHSVGEIAAATVAGALGLADAATVVCRRSAALAAHPRGGVMWWVGVPAEAARRDLAEGGGEAEVAVVNSEGSCVVAGHERDLVEVVARWQAAGVPCRRIPVAYASHSVDMESLREQLVPALAGVRPGPTSIPMVSTVHVREIAGDELDAAYWMGNLRRPVQFGAVVAALLERDPTTCFVEISPHPTLLGAIRETVARRAATATAVASVSREEPLALTTARSAAALYEAGCDLDWGRVQPGGRHTTVPTYPWQRTRHWPHDARQGTLTVVAAAPIAPAPGAARPAVAPIPATPASLVAAPSLAAAPTVATGPIPTSGGDDAVVGVVPAVGVEAVVREELAQVLSLPGGDLDHRVPLRAYGLDSLFAVALGARLAKRCGRQLASKDIISARTVAGLVELLTGGPEGVAG